MRLILIHTFYLIFHEHSFLIWVKSYDILESLSRCSKLIEDTNRSTGMSRGSPNLKFVGERLHRSPVSSAQRCGAPTVIYLELQLRLFSSSTLKLENSLVSLYKRKDNSLFTEHFREHGQYFTLRFHL